MDRAATDLVPEAPRFSQVLRQRRKLRGFSKILAVLIGLDAKLRQYEQGERFIEAVEGHGGRALLDRVWEGPDNLPTLAEIRHPDIWIERVAAATGPVPMAGATQPAASETGRPAPSAVEAGAG